MDVAERDQRTQTPLGFVVLAGLQGRDGSFAGVQQVGAGEFFRRKVQVDLASLNGLGVNRITPRPLHRRRGGRGGAPLVVSVYVRAGRLVAMAFESLRKSGM